jgi:HK97 family phage portal protein
MTTPKDLQIIKSSTVTINFDETGNVVSYIQKVGQGQRVFKAEDVIHISLANIGGEPYGFTGLETLLVDVATLIFAKNYAGKFFENDGTPNFMFMMPEDNPDSRNVASLKTELRELKKKGEKYKNIVVTGKVEVKELLKFNKDMEFAKLIQHFTQIILIGMGVPTHRINYTITDSQSGSQVNRAYEGYYKKISFYQKLIENQFNKDLFIPFFKVEMKFNRAYKIDEMREAQIAQILAQIGAVTIEEIRDRIGMDPEIPEGTMPIKVGDQNSIDFEADKKREQGRENNPKPVDSEMDNKLKTFGNSFIAKQ